MANRTNTEQSPSDKVMKPEEVKAMMIQYQKDAALPSLLYVTKKLGEVEGILSVQSEPETALKAVQVDLKRLFDKLVEDAGIELDRESTDAFIGGDSV